MFLMSKNLFLDNLTRNWSRESCRLLLTDNWQYFAPIISDKRIAWTFILCHAQKFIAILTRNKHFYLFFRRDFTDSNWQARVCSFLVWTENRDFNQKQQLLRQRAMFSWALSEILKPSKTAKTLIFTPAKNFGMNESLWLTRINSYVMQSRVKSVKKSFFSQLTRFFN